MLTQEQLEAIRKRAEKATEGPWKIGQGANEVVSVRRPRRKPIITRPDADGLSDAEFIAHAREDVPKLLAEIGRLRIGIETTMKETTCDETWDFLNRLLDGGKPIDLPYRMGDDYE